MRLKSAAFLCACAVALCVSRNVARAEQANLGFPLISSYTATELGAEPSSFCATQDATGTVFFGGAALFWYDGDRWEHAAMDGTCSGMDFSADGKLWVCGEGNLGWFERTSASQQTWQFHSLKSKLPDDVRISGTNVFALPDRVVFVCDDRILTWRDNRFETLPMNGTRKLTAFRLNGTIFIHYRRDGLYVLGPNGLTLAVPQSRIGRDETSILSMAEEGPSTWLLATGDGLLKCKGGATEHFAPQISAEISSALLTSATRLPDGRYAFGTLRNGIVLMNRDGSLDRRITSADGLPTTCINDLFADREGNLWLTSPTHIARIQVSGGSTVFDERAHLAPRMYYSVVPFEGTIATANTTGMYVLDRTTSQFVPSNFLTEIAHELTAIGSDLVISGYRGAWRIRGGQKTVLRTTNRDAYVAAPSHAVPGATILAESNAIVLVLPNGDVNVVVDSLPAQVSSLAEDDDGNIWFGTDVRGIRVIRKSTSGPRRDTEPGAEFGLPKVEGTTFVTRTVSGALAIFSDNGGWVQPAGTHGFRPIEDYPARGVAAVSQSANGSNIWLVHKAKNSMAPCVAVVTLTSSSARWQAHSVPGLDAVGSPRSLYAETTPRQPTVLWIGGAKAILRHEVDPLAPAAPAPQSPLLHVYAWPRGAAAPTYVTGPLPYSTRSIEFDFAQPQFALRPLLRLETRIDGLDSDWVPAGRDSRRELSAIREGQYTFRVRAVAETGITSEPTVFTIEVAPPWWRTRAAVVAGSVLLGFLIYAGYRLRVRSLKRHNVVLEEKVRQRTEELVEASAAKTMFVANMSHDIRNPLNGIVGLALALEDTRLDSQQREIVATLRECTTYLSSLVDDVLDFASIEAGRVELRPGPFVPAELLNSVVTALKAETAEGGAFITIESDPEVPPMLHGDAGRIQQILVNYVSNALKYAGGHIRLIAAVSPHAPGEVEFSVADEGPGIPESEQKTLFTKFSRLEGARRNHIPGTGLGLASCRLLADIMGGSVGIESHLGAGARFYLRLPLAVATQPVIPANDIILPRTSVLLVEDTDYNALAATAVLRRLGLTCERARNGAEALQLFSAKRHNIVLLDRNLPDMDGNEIAREMRKLETDGQRAVLLAVTAYCTAEDRKLCLEAGMDAFVGKPLTPEKLRKVLIAVGRRMLTTSTIDVGVESVAPPASTLVDTTLLDYLAEGSEGGVAAQAERFIAALQEAHRELLSAAAAKDPKIFGDAAHRVLGHARMIGANQLTNVAIQLETAARSSDAGGIALALPLIETEVAAVTAALRRRPRVQRA